MSAGIQHYIKQRTELIERALRATLPVATLAGTESLNQALSHAVFPGGKRMRPILVLLGAEICGAQPEAGLPAACAVEFLHAASLVLDDLPAMDDAAIRRGRPTVHTVFGEDIALLAALALLNEAYAIFAGIPALLPRALREIGVRGMIGGQAADVRGSSARSRLEKTTALTRLTMAAGATAAGAAARETEELILFGDAIGEAYQICDDIVDALATADESGKTSGQDQRHSRYSLVEQFGNRGACSRVRELVDGRLERLRNWFGASPALSLLEEFAQSIVAPGLDLEKYDLALTVVGLRTAGSVERDSLASGSRG